MTHSCHDRTRVSVGHTAAQLAVTPLEDRCNPAPIGALDPGFGIGGLATVPGGGILNAVTADPAGGYVAVGTQGDDVLVVKFLSDGTRDPMFNGGAAKLVDVSGVGDRGSDVFVRPDGTILIAGTATVGGDDDMFLVALSADGTTVQATRTVDVDNASKNDTGTALAVNSATGDIYVVGSAVDPVAGDADFAIARFDAGLNFIADARIGGTADNDAALGVTIDAASGQLFLAGTADTDTNIGLARVDADLTNGLFRTRDAGGGVEFGNDIVRIPGTNRLFIAGVSDRAGGAPQFLVAEVNPGNLTLANTRSINVGGVSSATSIGVDGFNRLVVGGTANVTGTAADQAVVRLTPDTLELDPTFGGTGVFVNDANPGGIDGTADAVVDPAGRIVAVGTAGPNPAAIRVTASTGLPSDIVATGPDNGTGSLFRLNDTLTGLNPTPTGVNLLPGGGIVRVAQGDITGDGVLDVIAVSGPGGGTVRVLDGVTGNEVANFTPFGAGFAGGIWVAAGDFTGDGRAEIVVAPDRDGGVDLIIFDANAILANPNQPAQAMRFNPLIDDQGVAQTTNLNIEGVRPAVGDINGDGVPELVIGAGILGGPRVVVFDGLRIRDMTADDGIAPLANFFVFEQNQRDGAFVAIGDVNGDGVGDIVAGGGPSGGPRVRIVDGAALVAAGIGFGLDPDANPGTLNNFFVGDENTRGGIRVMTADVDGDNLADVITGSGDRLPSVVSVIPGTVLAQFPSGTANPPTSDLDPMFGVLTNGVFVG